MHLLHPTGILKLSFRLNWIQEAKKSVYGISSMLFSNMDFNLAYFADLKFAHFETEEGFGLIWVKLQNSLFYLQIYISGILKVLFSIMGFIFLVLCITEVLGKIEKKITE